VTRSLAQVLDVELGVCEPEPEGPSSAVVLPVDNESPAAVLWSLGRLPVTGHLQLQRPQLSLSSAVTVDQAAVAVTRTRTPSLSATARRPAAAAGGGGQRKPLAHVPHERKLIDHATFEHELRSWSW
jgi:hypothetical protein